MDIQKSPNNANYLKALDKACLDELRLLGVALPDSVQFQITTSTVYIEYPDLLWQFRIFRNDAVSPKPYTIHAPSFGGLDLAKDSGYADFYISLGQVSNNWLLVCKVLKKYWDEVDSVYENVSEFKVYKISGVTGLSVQEGVTRMNDKSVWINGKRQKISNNYYSYHFGLADAVKALKHRASEKIARAESQLKFAGEASDKLLKTLKPILEETVKTQAPK